MILVSRSFSFSSHRFHYPKQFRECSKIYIPFKCVKFIFVSFSHLSASYTLQQVVPKWHTDVNTKPLDWDRYPWNVFVSPAKKPWFSDWILAFISFNVLLISVRIGPRYTFDLFFYIGLYLRTILFFFSIVIISVVYIGFIQIVYVYLFIYYFQKTGLIIKKHKYIIEITRVKCKRNPRSYHTQFILQRVSSFMSAMFYWLHICTLNFFSLNLYKIVLILKNILRELWIKPKFKEKNHII